MAQPASQLVSIGAVVVLSATSLAVAHRRDRSCVPSSLSMVEMTRIMAKGNCPDIGPVQFCDQEEFCADNNCTGDPHPMQLPGGGQIYVKDCVKTIDVSKEYDEFNWYEPVAFVKESSLWVDSDQYNCFTKCPCLEYCLYDSDDEEWYCETNRDEEACVDTG